MSDRIIVVQDRQSVWDIAISEYGSVEAAFMLLRDNPTLSGLDAELQAGQQLRISSAPVNADVVDFYRVNGHYPVTEYVAPEQELACDEVPNALRITISDNYDGAAAMTIGITSTHYAYKAPGSPRVVMEAEMGFASISNMAIGEHCLFACNEEGIPEGEFTGSFAAYFMRITSVQYDPSVFQCTDVDISFGEIMASVPGFVFPAASLVYMADQELPDTLAIDMPNVESFSINEPTPGLVELQLPASLPNCVLVELVGMALNEASVDAVINALSALNAEGQVYIIGGTNASPGAASATRRAELVAASWIQFYN